MLQELLTIFRGQSPLKALGDNFSEMLSLSLGITQKAGEMFVAQEMTPEERTKLRKQDVKINKLQRRIRKQVIFHLSMEGNRADLPYCLLLISLVKDVERIGDYAKDIADLVNLSDEELPDDTILGELKEIRAGVEQDFAGAVEIYNSADRDRAIELIQCGQDTVDRCQKLVANIAYTTHPAGIVAKLVLAVWFYERVAGHVLNLLSSTVMPLHKLDYYDERDIAKAEKKLSQ